MRPPTAPRRPVPAPSTLRPTRSPESIGSAESSGSAASTASPTGRGRAGETAPGQGAGSGHGRDLVLAPEELDAFEGDGTGSWVSGDPGDPAGGAGRSGRSGRAGPPEGVAVETVDPLAEEAPAPVSTLEDRLAERRRAYRRVLWFRIGAMVAAAALVVLLGWLVFFSPVLALRGDRVAVEGAGPYVDVAAVTALAAAEAGTPLARLDTGAIADAVSGMPAVASATVTRAWPGGLTVAVTPREPVAAAGDPGAEVVGLVGSDGVVVASVPPDAVPPGLPWLTVDMGRDGAEESVAAVLGVLAALPAELTAQLAQAGATSPEAITFELIAGGTVAWGDASDTELKAQVLLTLLQVGASWYDVSAPEAPITR